MHEIYLNLDNSNNRFWYQIFKLMNNYYQIDWIEYKNKYYFNCTNQWFEGDEVIQKMRLHNIEPCHKNHVCDGYEDCENFKKYNRINVDSISNVNYTFSGTIDVDDLKMWIDGYEDDEDEEEDEDELNKNNTEPEVNKIILEMSQLNLPPREIKFISTTDIVIINDCGFNGDHRGSDHTTLKLPWVDRVHLGKEFTFHDLLSANANLKSHKFDNNYELFCTTNCKAMNDLIKVELHFDHGS